MASRPQISGPLTVSDAPALGWHHALAVGPLSGCGVWVARPLHQARKLCEVLTAQGADVFLFPVFEIVLDHAPEHWSRCWAQRESYDGVLWTSANAVRAWTSLAAQESAEMPWSTLRSLSIGKATTRALAEVGIPHEPMPAPAHAATMLATLAEKPQQGRRYLFPCSHRARRTLPEGLEALGAEVECLPLYRPVPTTLDLAPLHKALLQAQLQIVVATSPSSVEATLTLLDTLSLSAHLSRWQWVAIGPTTAKAIRSHCGLEPVVARDAGHEGLVEAVARVYAAQEA